MATENDKITNRKVLSIVLVLSGFFSALSPFLSEPWSRDGIFVNDGVTIVLGLLGMGYGLYLWRKTSAQERALMDLPREHDAPDRYIEK